MGIIEKKDIKSWNQEELGEFLVTLGEKPFRAKQIYPWLHIKHAASFEEMTDISKKLKQKLSEVCELTVLQKVQVQCSQIDGTRKYLFALSDKNMIESVLMRYQHGNSVCISSQVGCRMGCRFCASTLDGLVRGLTPGEMLDQIYRIQEDIGERAVQMVSGIVNRIGHPLQIQVLVQVGLDVGDCFCYRVGHMTVHVYAPVVFLMLVAVFR